MRLGVGWPWATVNLIGVYQAGLSKYVNRRDGVFCGSSHKRLTKLDSACYDSVAFSEIVESALFLPGEYG